MRSSANDSNRAVAKTYIEGGLLLGNDGAMNGPFHTFAKTSEFPGVRRRSNPKFRFYSDFSKISGWSGGADLRGDSQLKNNAEGVR